MTDMPCPNGEINAFYITQLLIKFLTNPSTWFNCSDRTKEYNSNVIIEFFIVPLEITTGFCTMFDVAWMADDRFETLLHTSVHTDVQTQNY